MNKFIFANRLAFFLSVIMLVFFVPFSTAQTTRGLTIVTFGNSTTAPRKNIDKVYAVRLQEYLKDEGLESTVINAGNPSSHSGSIKDNDFAKIAHGMDRFDSGVIRYHPDWVTINFGLNDSWQDNGAKGTSRIPVTTYRHNLSFYIDKIRENKGRVILLTPNPVGKKFYGYHKKRLKKYRRVVKKLSKEKNVAVIDTWKLFEKYIRKNHMEIDSLLLDGIHPGDTGHDLIAKEIVRIITGFKNNEQVISGDKAAN